MGKLLSIKPELHFPWGVPFEIPDEFNGHQRGTWYYRHPHKANALRGPFSSLTEAQHFYDKEHHGEV